MKRNPIIAKVNSYNKMHYRNSIINYRDSMLTSEYIFETVGWWILKILLFIFLVAQVTMTIIVN